MTEYRYCPNCGAEYRPGFTDCFDCRIPLVDEPPDKSGRRGGREPSPVVEVYRAGRVDAQVVCSALEGHGIAAVVDNEGGGGYPVTVGDLGSAGVFVQADDLDAATEIIESYEAALAGDFGDDDYDDDYEAEPRPLLWESPLVRATAFVIALCLLVVYGLEQV